jgi:hypothetical protein
MDDGMTQVVEACFRNARENPDEIARWLAVEVLLTDPAALEDDTLVERLLALQDRLEVHARVRYGLPTEPRTGQTSVF